MKIKEKRTIEKITACKGTENEKVLLFEKISRYDEHGNEIYYKGSSDETWTSYNELGLPTSIRSKNKAGKETWSKYEYDENGNEIYFESSYGSFRKTIYNDKGDRLYYKDEYSEFKYEYDYDDKDRLIYQKSKDCVADKEFEFWFDYKGEQEEEQIVYADAQKTEIVSKYFREILVYDKYEGKETWITLDKLGAEISKRTKDSEGNEFWSETQYEYDENNNIIYCKHNDSEGNFDETTYNDKGFPTHSKFKESETWNQYEYDENGKILYWKEDTWYYSEEREEPLKLYNETWFKYDSEGNEIWYKYKNNEGAETEKTTTYIYYPE